MPITRNDFYRMVAHIDSDLLERAALPDDVLADVPAVSEFLTECAQS